MSAGGLLRAEGSAPHARPTTEYVLSLDCVETPGIVHAVSGFLLEHGCDIIDNRQHGDRGEGHFFMRVHVTSASTTLGQLRDGFSAVAGRYAMSWRIEPERRRRRVLIMVSRYDHCLNDLLYRARTGDLPVEVVAVVSNHPDHRELVEWHHIPFVHLPVTPDTKQRAEEDLRILVAEHDVELVILARYMQVLSDDLCEALAGRIINIHHSFLPSFKGGKPYHQAFERGVKLVGATAHYVTADLDEGPIIAQQVIEVDHTHIADDLVLVGRDAESAALSQAVRWHCEDRVFVHGRRTVVLR